MEQRAWLPLGRRSNATSPQRLATYSLAGIFVVVSTVAGCSSWHARPQTGTPRLPSARMSEHSVGLEIAMVTFPSEKVLADVLAVSDEQILPVSDRRRLIEGGVRLGSLGSQVPQAVVGLLEDGAREREHPTAENPAHLHDYQRFVQCRAGRKIDVSLGQRVPEVVVQPIGGVAEGATHSRTLTDAEFFLELTCRPKGVSGAVLEFQPRVDFGLIRQKWGVAEDGFQKKFERESLLLDQLDFQVPLRPGEILMLSSNLVGARADGSPHPRPAQVGWHLLFDAQKGLPRGIFIRLAQTEPSSIYHEQLSDRLLP